MQTEGATAGEMPSTSPPGPQRPERIFFRRLGAVVADCVIIGLLGFGLCAAFFEPLVHIGDRGRLIGLAIAIAYATVFDARGGTPGKRIFRLTVRNPSGAVPGFRRALVRNAVRISPWFLVAQVNTAEPPGFTLIFATSLPYAFYVGSLLVVALGAGHRAPHDWLAGLHVVRAGSWTKAPLQSKTLALFVAPFVLAAIVSLIRPDKKLQPLTKVAAAVHALPSHPIASVNDMTTTRVGTGVYKHVLQVVAPFQGPPAQLATFGRAVFDEVRDSGIDFSPYDLVTIAVRMQATLGIGFYNRDFVDSFQPENGKLVWKPLRNYQPLAAEGPATWVISGTPYEIRSSFYEFQDPGDGKHGLYYVVEWNCAPCAPLRLNEAQAQQLAAPIFRQICETKAWQRFALPSGTQASRIGVQISDRSAGATVPHYGVIKDVADVCAKSR